MTLESSPPLPPGRPTASASNSSQAFVAGESIHVDQSRHFHDNGADSDAIPLVRRITAEDVPGFVGRADELGRLARLLTPGAPRGGPLVLCPEKIDQAGIGVTTLAVQAASRAVAAGWFPGGAVLVSPHAGGVSRSLALDRTLASVLAALGVPPGQWDGGPGGGQAAYERAMEALAAARRPVLIVIEEVRESDARLVEGLAAHGPHRMLLTAWEPQYWMINPRVLAVRYLTEDESVGVLSAALSPDLSGSLRPSDPLPYLRCLARRCLGVARALRIAASELALRPELPIAGFLQALAGTYDQTDGGASAAGRPLDGLRRSLDTMKDLLAPVWDPPPQPGGGGPPVIGRHALLSWLVADHLSGQPSAWDVVGPQGSGKSTLLAAAAAALAANGARVVTISMERPVDNYQRRVASARDPLVIELARTQLCMDVARAAGQKLAEAENLAVGQLIYLADQSIQELLATRPEGRPDLDVADVLIPRGTGTAVAPLDPAVSADYAGRVRAVRMSLGQLVAGALSGPPAGTGRLAVLVDNLHLVTDAACREWIATVFCDLLDTVTVSTRRPGGQVFCDAAVTHVLSDFTRAETLDYLTQVGQLDPQWVDDQVLDVIMARTHGTPQAVAVQCDELISPPRGAIGPALDQSVLSAESEATLDRSLLASARRQVAQACTEVLGRDLPIVLEFVAVLRPVSARLLGDVLSPEGVTRDQADQLVVRLTRCYGIMTSPDNAQAGSLRLHDRIRRSCLEEMPPGTRRRRHERAEAVYADLVAGYEPEWDPEAGDAFTVWARFEEPGFQSLLREWLFHAMRSQGKELSPRTAVRITQVFLEAFWWWGWYLRSPVCEQLLREFDLISADKSEADRQWLADLSILYRNYRQGFVYNKPGQGHRDWAEVGPAMRGLRRRVHLASGKSMDQGRHSIDIITNVYLAQSIAFRDPGGDPGKAAGYFAAARAALRRSVAAGHQGHRWYDGWIVYFTADMWHSCGRMGEAVAQLRELDAMMAADTDGDLFDRDLISRATGLTGNVYLALGNDDQAVDACARAALQAYGYHVSQETPGQPPNEYTYERQAETMADVAACLTEVRARCPDAWCAGLRRMCTAFAPYWRLAGGRSAGQFVPPDGPTAAGWPADDAPALPEGILPPLPDRSQLGRLDSPFAQLARRVADEVAPLLDTTLLFRDSDAE